MINQLNEPTLVFGRFLIATKTVENNIEMYRIVDITDKQNIVIMNGRTSERGILTLLNQMIGKSMEFSRNNKYL